MMIGMSRTSGRLDGLGELEAVHARHLDVEQDHVGDCSDQHLQRVDAVLRRRHGEASREQQAARDLAHRERVVDDHHERLAWTGTPVRAAVARSRDRRWSRRLGTSARARAARD
jgi:hypothetical protein